MNLVTLKDKEQIGKALFEALQSHGKQCVDQTGSFLVAYPGGSVISMLGTHFAGDHADFANWHWCLVDERHVSLSDNESNYRLVSNEIPHGHPIALQYHCDPAEMAVHYEEQARQRLKELGKSHLDAVVLGVGPDGHIASLFPERTWSSEEMFFVVRNSPKPPPTRITMSLSWIATASKVFVVICGEEKRDALRMVLNGDPRTPLASLSGFWLYTDQTLIETINGGGLGE